MMSVCAIFVYNWFVPLRPLLNCACATLTHSAVTDNDAVCSTLLLTSMCACGFVGFFCCCFRSYIWRYVDTVFKRAKGQLLVGSSQYDKIRYTRGICVHHIETLIQQLLLYGGSLCKTLSLPTTKARRVRFETYSTAPIKESMSYHSQISLTLQSVTINSFTLQR